jgi:hypothetical protein
MRRALLVAARAAPSLVFGQNPAPGQITFTEGSNDLVHGPWISLAECLDPTSQVSLGWSTTLVGSAVFPADARYQVYASNQPSPTDACYTAANGADVVAGPVGAALAGLGQTVTGEPYRISDLLAAAGVANCGAVSGDVRVHVCAQAYDPYAATVGVAKGALTLSITSPAAPTSVTVEPWDGALGISWTAPSGDPPAHDYRVVASSDPALDPNVHTVLTGAIGATLGCSITGLVNGARYGVQVYARSQAGNESAPSAAVVATPVAAASGRPVLQRPQGSGQGGCSAGGAGPVALLAMAALRARPRRRAR